MNEMNTFAFVNFLLIKLFPTLIHQNFPLSKICAIRYVLFVYSHFVLLAIYLIIDAVCIHLDTNYDFFPVEFTRKFKEVVVYNKMSRNIPILSLVMSC